MSGFSKFKQQTIDGSVFEKTAESRLAFIKKVYLYFAIALAFAFAGAVVTTTNIDIAVMVANNYLFFVIAEIGVLIATIVLRKKEPINRILFFAFTTLSGITLGPMLWRFQLANQMGTVVMALGLTVLAFAGLTTYAFTTKKDFSYLQGFLFTGLFILIGALILSFFVKSPILYTAISAGGVILFSMFILYDTHNIMKRYNQDEYIAGAIDLFLDFLNLFIYILRLLSSRD